MQDDLSDKRTALNAILVHVYKLLAMNDLTLAAKAEVDHIQSICSYGMDARGSSER